MPVVLNGPAELDGKPVFVQAPNTTGFMTWFTGRGDDLAPTPPASGRGDGAQIKLEWDNVEARGSKSVDFQFSEVVELHDGEVFYGDGGLIGGWTTDDELSFSAVIPATVATVNGTNEGNCNLVDAGGYNIIVPAVGDGTHDIVLADAVPVPAGYDGGGYWDANYRTGDVTPAVKPGDSETLWHLLDIPVESFFLKRLPLGNPLGAFEIDAYKAEWIPPSWKLRLSVTKNSTGAGQLAGWLMLFREKST